MEDWRIELRNKYNKKLSYNLQDYIIKEYELDNSKESYLEIERIVKELIDKANGRNKEEDNVSKLL